MEKEKNLPIEQYNFSSVPYKTCNKYLSESKTHHILLIKNTNILYIL